MQQQGYIADAVADYERSLDREFDYQAEEDNVAQQYGYVYETHSCIHKHAHSYEHTNTHAHAEP